MQEYPQLPPIQLRDEVDPEYQKVAWKPNWNCFCCHDTGFITDLLTKKLIPNYVSGKHKPVECNASNCKIQLGKDFYETNTLDQRFDPEICDRLDQDEREMWREWSMQQHEKRKFKLDLSNATNNLRARARLPCEHFDVQRRHEDIKTNY